MRDDVSRDVHAMEEISTIKLPWEAPVMEVAALESAQNTESSAGVDEDYAIS